MGNVRAISLFLACVIYGLFGSPTPDNFGWAEAMVGLLLVLAIDPAMFIGGLRQMLLTAHGRVGAVFLFYGFAIMGLGGVLSAHAPGLILRDMIPFLFLLIPLFLRFETAEQRRMVTGGVLAIGVLFSARLVGPWADGQDFLYLSIAPTILFSGLFLAGMAGYILFRRVTFIAIVQSGFLAAISCLCVMAMALTMQRASLALFAFGLFLLALVALWTAPVRALAPLLLGVGVVLMGYPVLMPIIEGLAFKHSAVGLNMRWQEAEAVLKTIHEGGLGRALFGLGWGATIESPAVGGVAVNFTHNFFSSMLLKGGWVAVLFSAAYLFYLCLPALYRWRSAPVVMVALFAPVAIDVTLYASFKSLDFGLLLLLLVLWGSGHKIVDQSVDKIGKTSGDGRSGAVAPGSGIVYP